MSAPIVDSAVILPHVDVGRGCTIKRAIIDEGCQIPDGMSIGTDLALDAQRFHVTENGVVLVTADMLRRLSSLPQAVSAAPARLPVVLLWHMHQPQYRDALSGPVRPAVDLPARHQGLHRHGGAPGGEPGRARGGELHPGAARAAG